MTDDREDRSGRECCGAEATLSWREKAVITCGAAG
jgi:hypothetical protein